MRSLRRARLGVLAIGFLVLVLPPVAAADFMPAEGDVYPLHEVHSSVVGHLSGMLAGPFTGPCAEPAAAPPVPRNPDGNFVQGFQFVYVGVTQDTLFQGYPTTLAGAPGSVSPGYAHCRPGFNNGSNLDLQPIYASQTGTSIATYRMRREQNRCCGVSVGYYTTDEDTAASFEDVRSARFTIVDAPPAKRFTDDEKTAFSKKSTDLNLEAGAAGALAASCGFFPEPGPSKLCALLGAVDTAFDAAASYYYSRLAADPIDRRYKVVAAPAKLSLPSAAAAGVPAGAVAAVDRLQSILARSSGLGDALDTAINRSQGAHVAHNRAAEKRQLAAARGYATKLAALLGQEQSARAAVAQAAKAAGLTDVTATPEMAVQAQHDNFVPNAARGDSSDNPGKGPTPQLRGLLNALSPSKAILINATSRMVSVPLPKAPVTFYGMLEQTASQRGSTAAIKALRSFARKH